MPEKYVLYFGRYSEEKGINTLAEACKQLLDISFVFAGTGPLEDKVNSLPNVKNVGFKTEKELNVLIREARFTVYPSEWYENCPFSVMESLIRRTPVLAAKNGGISELVSPGKAGELFESGNVGDLKEKIELLWGDKELRNCYSENCKKNQFWHSRIISW